MYYLILYFDRDRMKRLIKKNLFTVQQQIRTIKRGALLEAKREIHVKARKVKFS